MKITNKEVIHGLNCIGAFLEAEKVANKALLSAKGEYAITTNKNRLVEVYKTFDEAKQGIDDNAELENLLNTEVEILDFVKITSDDFKDGITANLIMSLEFMTE